MSKRIRTASPSAAESESESAFPIQACKGDQSSVRYIYKGGPIPWLSIPTPSSLNSQTFQPTMPHPILTRKQWDAAVAATFAARKQVRELWFSLQQRERDYIKINLECDVEVVLADIEKDEPGLEPELEDNTGIDALKNAEKKYGELFVELKDCVKTLRERQRDGTLAGDRP